MFWWKSATLMLCRDSKTDLCGSSSRLQRLASIRMSPGAAVKIVSRSAERSGVRDTFSTRSLLIARSPAVDTCLKRPLEKSAALPKRTSEASLKRSSPSCVLEGRGGGVAVIAAEAHPSLKPQASLRSPAP